MSVLLCTAAHQVPRSAGRTTVRKRRGTALRVNHPANLTYWVQAVKADTDRFKYSNLYMRVVVPLDFRADIGDATETVAQPASLGAAIRAFRASRYRTQKAMGEALGVTVETVSAWENDHIIPKGENQAKLREAGFEGVFPERLPSAEESLAATRQALDQIAAAFQRMAADNRATREAMQALLERQEAVFAELRTAVTRLLPPEPPDTPAPEQR